MVAALTCHDVSKTYGRGELSQTVVDRVTLSLARGATCVLVGPSGSGKTTLLSMWGCLLTPTAGEVHLDGQPVPYASPRLLADLRRTKLGFVFQHAQLLPFLSVEENLRIVGRNAGMEASAIIQRTAELAERLGIAGLMHRKPGELSGGQRQRAAIARAVLHRPSIILADEPTAALDRENGQAAVSLLIEQAKAHNALLIAVTHDTRLLHLFDQQFSMESGKPAPMPSDHSDHAGQ